ncbi:CHAD domain-containing protein [Streptomyces katsurahamanus]|uniref:CHAD domain-containing protein n=1 Tax=Streptomyces katsurahamanus TaxID=2577098 RepID=UPI002B21ED61|nr:CHAD domain-containing protein [Streptomyces katsurahamanus]
MHSPDLSRVPAQGSPPAQAPARAQAQAQAQAGGDGALAVGDGAAVAVTVALTAYLHARAGEFLRGLRLYGDSGADTAAATEAARSLRMTARRIGGTLHTFRPLLDPVWADGLRTELSWLSGTLAQEHASTARLNRLLDALARLSGTATGAGAGTGTVPGTGAAPDIGAAGGGPGRGALTVGAARAAALLERRLTLARTRAHSATLQALGSARCHAVADAVAVLTSELPPAPAAGALPLPDGADAAAERRLLDAVAALPLARAGHPYNAEALLNGLATASAEELQDEPWHRVRTLLRLHRYALEVLGPERNPVLDRAGQVLDRHRDASEAAAAAAAAARTPRIAPATAYALGVLHADQRHEVEAARFAFQEIWQGSIAVQAAL